MPGSFSATPETTSRLSFSPLSGMDLEELTLQRCRLDNNTTFGTLSALRVVGLAVQQHHDAPVRLVDVEPEPVVRLRQSALDDRRLSRPQSIKGKLINIDLAPDHPEKATTIADLAAALYYLPIEMYEYVVNTIEFQPYQGAMKGAIGHPANQGRQRLGYGFALGGAFCRGRGHGHELCLGADRGPDTDRDGLRRRAPTRWRLPTYCGNAGLSSSYYIQIA